MKFNDVLWGALLVLLGAALLVHVQSFPTIPGQRVGPGLFPGLIAVGFCVCGVILVVRGWRARAAGGADAAWYAWPDWSRSPRHVLGFAVLVAVNLFYLFAVDTLGFVVTGSIYLAALMWVLKVRPARIVPIAVVLTLAIHFCFYKLLRVPLPWGWLQPIAW
ncbi:MAG: tripartite tricarboxylate transporter TctB family protein [Pseudomonadota bacterium]|nr:tripartite tricarboxylate transporter TctB family protein [Pseudomonadota bacterium]